jgi:hypothetical protein
VSGTSYTYATLNGAERDAVMRRDAAVARLKHQRGLTGPGRAELLEAFRNSPMTGMTTVIDLARRKSGYNPLGKSDDNQQKLLPFMMELAKSGLFSMSSHSNSFDIEPGKPGKDVAAAIAQFVGTDPVLAPAIRGQLEDVMRMAVTTLGQAQSREMLREHTLTADGRYLFTHANCSVRMVVVMLPPMNYLTQGSGVRGSMVFEFKTAEWPKAAERILDEHLKTVTDWLDETGGLR